MEKDLQKVRHHQRHGKKNDLFENGPLAQIHLKSVL